MDKKTTARQRFEFVEANKFNDFNTVNFDDSLELKEFDVNSATNQEVRQVLATLIKYMKNR